MTESPRAADTPEIHLLYAQRFNRRDWDGSRELISEDAQLRIRHYTRCPWLMRTAHRIVVNGVRRILNQQALEADMLATRGNGSALMELAAAQTAKRMAYSDSSTLI